jgi:hypothetical protein
MGSCLSISSFSVMVFACFLSLTVRACTLATAYRLANFAALQASAPLRFCRQSVYILSFAPQIDFRNCALAWAVTADLLCPLISLLSRLLLCLSLPFHLLSDRELVLSFLAVVTSPRASAFRHHLASLSTLLPVHSTPNHGCSLASSQLSL